MPLFPILPFAARLLAAAIVRGARYDLLGWAATEFTSHARQWAGVVRPAGLATDGVAANAVAARVAATDAISRLCTVVLLSG
jgi:hypothetical protein